MMHLIRQLARHPRQASQDLWTHLVATAARPGRLRELRLSVKKHSAKRDDFPTFSLLCLPHEEASHQLGATIRSLRDQLYSEWELVVVGPDPWINSSQSRLGRLVDQLPIQWVSVTEGATVAEQLNLAVESAVGGWCGVIESGDRLAIETLLWAWVYQERSPHLQWMYTDESSPGLHGRAYYLKPDFSPELLLSQMFTGNLSLFHRNAIARVNGFRDGYGEACVYDLCLRLSETLPTASIGHISHALYHRATKVQGVTGTIRNGKENGLAIRDCLNRRNLRAEVSFPGRPGRYPKLRFLPNACPRVTIIIPTRDAADLLIPCIESARREAGYENYEILVIDNQSDDKVLLDYLAMESQQGGLVVFRYDGPFNYSEMHNLALNTVESELFVLLNNDVTGFSSGWLEELVATTELGPDIAGVGTKLLYPNGTIQHAGMLMGVDGVAVHSHIGHSGDSDGYWGRLVSLQECSGATAALLLLRTTAFRSVGGFDAEAFPNSYGDVDLWLRLRRAGYRCVYNPSVMACHHESKTRGKSSNEDEYRQRLEDRWGEALSRDPFYHPGFSSRNQFVVDRRVNSLDELVRRLHC